jgi:lipopolysaccharide export system permease protein
LDEFIEKEAPLKDIVFKYYLNFIPYFSNLFSALFTFIAVIYFTSKMAFNTEIVAILNSGMSFRRMMLPYFLSAFFLASLSFVLGSYIIPPANKIRLEFEEVFLRNPIRYSDRNLHKQIDPGIFMYVESFNNVDKVGYKFSLEKFENNQLVSKLNSDAIRWDSINHVWKLQNFRIRQFVDSLQEKLTFGVEKDTMINLHPSEFARRTSIVETMSLTQLIDFIEEQKMQGSDDIDTYEIEKHSRFAFPFSTFILTLIGVSIASRKVKGGIGLHIGIGFLLSFSYILFMQVSKTFAVEGSMDPMLAVWIPNIFYTIIALYLYRIAPK